MWFFLFGLIGAAAGAGGGGGGSSAAASEPARKTVDILPILDPPADVLDEDEDDENVFDNLGDDDDDVEAGDDDIVADSPMGDDTMAGGHADDHMGDETVAGGACDPAGDGVTGPCPKTGEAVCHCNDDRDDHDHSGHDHGHTHIELPTTPAEVEAFVAAVRAAPEMQHMHDHGSAKANEHMAAMDLTPRDEATHIAIAHGDWNDPSNWHNGEVPGDDARVLIPEGVHVVYEGVHEERLFTLRVDGHLDFANDADSRMVVDTIVVSPSGKLTIGTADSPIPPDVDVEIVFANNGPIDTDWDPMLLSRGMIAHGEVEIHGAVKDSHEKVVDDPMAGDTWIDFAESPDGWQVGDTIIIAGTSYEGYYYGGPQDPNAYSASEDEERVVTDIQGGRVFFDEPLVFDHDTPREDLKTSVANYTRNVSFETENAATAEIYERGHVMFMHNDDVDVRYAEFHELGRTDKSEPALSPDNFDPIEFDSNVTGRYSFHFHRAGVDDADDPGMAVGNAVYGSPGWGFVHHDSHAVFDNNATYNTFGAGYVAEDGNETGAWTDNIAIYAKGVAWEAPKNVNDTGNFDLGKSGDGFWFQSRMVESVGNVAASVNHGFVYFHRGAPGDILTTKFDSDVTDIEEALRYASSVNYEDHPILSFSGNETFASRAGLTVTKGNPNQEHDVHSVLEDFTAWNVEEGAALEYTSHYILKNFDLVRNDATDDKTTDFGIRFGNLTTDMTVVDANIEGFDVGIDLFKDPRETFEGQDLKDLDFEYAVIDPVFKNVDTEYLNYDASQDIITSSQSLPFLKPDIDLDAPLTFNARNAQDPDSGIVKISGTKSDSLGVSEYPAGTDNFSMDLGNVREVMEQTGYYTTSYGQDYFLIDLFFADRLTGDIYTETHPVLLDDNINLEFSPIWENVSYNGIRELDANDGLASEEAQLWGSIVDGQLVRTDGAETAGDDLSEMAAADLWDMLTNDQPVADEMMMPEEDEEFLVA